MVPGGGFHSLCCCWWLCTLLKARISVGTTTHFHRNVPQAHLLVMSLIEMCYVRCILMQSIIIIIVVDNNNPHHHTYSVSLLSTQHNYLYSFRHSRERSLVSFDSQEEFYSKWSPQSFYFCFSGVWMCDLSCTNWLQQVKIFAFLTHTNCPCHKKCPTFSQVHYLFANQSILYSLQTKILFLFSRKHAATLEQATGGLISSITSFVCGVLVTLVLLWIIIASLMSMKQPNLYFHFLFLCCRLGVCL